MPLKLEIRTRARRDLHAITLFIAAQNGDFVIASRLAQRLLDQCENLIEAPGMGSPYKQRAGIRKLNEGAYKIFYQVGGDRLTILRIWDGRRGQEPQI